MFRHIQDRAPCEKVGQRENQVAADTNQESRNDLRSTPSKDLVSRAVGPGIWHENQGSSAEERAMGVAGPEADFQIQCQFQLTDGGNRRVAISPKYLR